MKMVMIESIKFINMLTSIKPEMRMRMQNQMQRVTATILRTMMSLVRIQH
jgi:hypothetical protein